MAPEEARVEDFETRFWMRTIKVGGWATLLMGFAGTAYAVSLTEADNRDAIAVLTLVTCALGVVSLEGALGRRLIASPRRQVGLLCWTLVTIALVTAMSALDGGATSPLALGLVLPAVFASVAYSLRAVLLIGAAAVGAYLALALVGSPGSGAILVYCSVLGGTVAMAAWQAHVHQEWRRALARSSQTDPLTGLLNRRGLSPAAAAAFSEVSRRRRPVVLVLIDLDLFKAFNDIHGHQAGDELLRWTADRWTGAVRPSDSVARLGGDEFAVLLPGADRATAEPVLMRLREGVEERIDFCLGVSCAPEDGASFDELYRAADADLYQRKLLRPRAEGGSASSEEAAFEHRKRQRPLSADAILAGITEAFLVLDDEWRFAYVNQAAARLIGRSRHDLLGRSLWEAYPETVGSRFEEVYRRVAASGLSETFVEFYPPLETTFSVKASAVPGGLSVYFHDVSRMARPAATESSGTSGLLGLNRELL